MGFIIATLACTLLFAVPTSVGDKVKRLEKGSITKTVADTMMFYNSFKHHPLV